MSSTTGVRTALKRSTSSSAPATTVALGVVLNPIYDHISSSSSFLVPLFRHYFSSWTDQAVAQRRRPRLGPCPPDVIDNTLSLAARLSRGQLRLDAVPRCWTHRRAPPAGGARAEVDALATRARRPLSSGRRSDLNDPKLITPRQAGGYGLPRSRTMTSTTHSTSRSPASGRGTTPTSAHSGAVARRWRGRSFTADVVVVPRPGTRPSGRPSRNPGHRFIGYLRGPTIRSATGPRQSAGARSARLDSRFARRCCSCSPYTPMLFMGEESAARTPWQFFTSTRPELGRGRPDRPPHRVLRARLGGGGHPRPAVPGHLRAVHLDWRELSVPGFAGSARLVPRPDHAPASSTPKSPIQLGTLHVSPARRPSLVLHRGDLRLACNLVGEVDNVAWTGPSAWCCCVGEGDSCGAVLEMPPESFAVVSTADRAPPGERPSAVE